MKMIDFVKAVIIFWALVFIIMALAHAQTPSCVGKHTAREICACQGWPWDETHNRCASTMLNPVTLEEAQKLTITLTPSDLCGLPAVISADGRHCVQNYTVTKPAPKAVCVYADHGSTATIKCSWKAGGK